jgi:predicted enzyme related to lactoylglutathione lyase
MTNSEESTTGSIAWRDLTVDDAEGIRDFYKDVVGWESSPVSMGEYSDFNMLSPTTQETVAGICHAKGTNANLPAQWMIYIVVENVDASAGRCQQLGGHVIVGPKPMGSGRFCVIRDPAGAVCALYQTRVNED